MKIIEQKHVILNPSVVNFDSQDWRKMIKRIEAAGRTCYKSENKITDSSAPDFVRRIIRSGHHSVIEHESISVRFITDRGVTHEMVRHRIAAFSQESTRYCDYSKALQGEFTAGTRADFQVLDGYGCEFINPVDFILSEEDLALLRRIEEHYNKARIERKLSPQQARYFLPNGLKTEIVMTANLREWRHVLKLRTSKAAHIQIRNLMSPLLRDLKAGLPCVFEDI
jgi:thymidylate synthase (FAD)